MAIALFMDNRTLIIERAHKMLMSIGPTSMTMDMVAKACGISKRTLYETFPDKKTLIMECLATEHTQRHQEACRIYQEAPNCFEALFSIFRTTRKYLDKRSQAFIDDVKRLYPEIIEQQHKHEQIFISQLSRALDEAQKEGLVVADINTEVASFLFISLMRSLHKNPNIETYGFDQVKIYEAAFINFMRGIATIQGIEHIERDIKDYLK